MDNSNLQMLIVYQTAQLSQLQNWIKLSSVLFFSLKSIIEWTAETLSIATGTMAKKWK